MKQAEFVITNDSLKQFIDVPENPTRELIIPDGVKRIDCKFYNNISLRKVAMPDSVEYGGWATFELCKNLREVRLSAKMDSINRRMFAETALEEVEIPENVKTIGNQAFEGCKNLRKVIIHSKDVTVSATAFFLSPKVVVYCHSELCERLHFTLNRTCFPLDQLCTETVKTRYYENDTFIDSYPIGEPVLKPATYKTIIGGKELKVRIKAESCFDREFDNGTIYYSFDEVREHFISKEETLEEYDRLYPDSTGDGFIQVTARLDDGASHIDKQIADGRMRFLLNVFRGLNDAAIAEKLSDFAQKKKNGYFSASGYTRVANAGVANRDLMIPEIVAKAKDETTLEVFAKQMTYSPEEIEKLKDDFLSSTFASTASENSEKIQNSPAAETFVSEIRCGNVSLPLLLIKTSDGKCVLKVCPERAPESFDFICGSPESGYDVNTELIRDSVISDGLSAVVIFDLPKDVAKSFKIIKLFYDYYRSSGSKKAFDAFVDGQFGYVNRTNPERARLSLDDVFDPAERIDSCVFAVLGSYEALIKGHTRYAQKIADELPRKSNGTLNRSGGGKGTNITDESEARNMGVIAYLSGRATADRELAIEFSCIPEWGRII